MFIKSCLGFQESQYQGGNCGIKKYWKAASSKSNSTLSCCPDKHRAASEEVWRVAPRCKFSVLF